ncbi:MAG TPA: ABC transporter ATP-binding protein [Puia sp.]|nr:ABC transporter ATP-binding protein [Puia sp.]
MIDIQNLTFGYKRNKLLYKNLNITLDHGSIYGLLGKNGAGKSTLLKNIVGLLFPIGGSIFVNGFDPKKRQPEFLQRIYFIPEEVFVPSLTIKRYINLYAPFYPKFDRKQCFEYLKVLEVANDQKLTSLSFGQQKKFIIAFSLACNTEILLLDEPTNGLDIPSKIQFRKLISSILTDQRTIFISTHQIRDLDSLIDKIIIIDNGELLLSASISKVADKLLFKTFKEIPENTGEILYAEDTFRGVSVVTQNKEGEDTAVNLEHLFNAVTSNPFKVKEIFNS